MARRPLRYTRSALLLMLAASLGTFAVANVATWTRSQGDQAAYQAGAAVRYTPSDRAASAWALAAQLEATPGVAGVMAADRLSVDAGRSVRNEALLAIDASFAGAVVSPTPGDDGTARAALFDGLVANRPSPSGSLVPSGSMALGLLLDATFKTAFKNGSPEPVDMRTFPGIRAFVVLEDGLGRFHRLEATTKAVLDGKGQRLVVDLAPGDPTAPFAAPIRLHAIELGISAPPDFGMTGTIVFREVDAASDAAADPASPSAWSSIGLASTTPGWSSRTRFGSEPFRGFEPRGDPWHLAFDNNSPLPPVFGGSTQEIGIEFVVTSRSPAPVDAIASTGFLEATGARVGDNLTASLEGTSTSVHVSGSVGSFPTLDPSQPFLIVDDRTMALTRFEASGGIEQPTEWWIATRDPAGVADAIRTVIDPGAATVLAADRAAALLADPIPRGVIGVLGLGSWAALVFAAIGFVVSATVSTRERLGEFALLRALGLSGRQLSLWLGLEHTFLLGVGVLAGIGLGAVLAWLVLPFATLTTTGAAVTPPPAVVIPLGSLLPILAGAAGVLAATLVVMRRQLLGIRIGDVLRAADE